MSRGVPGILLVSVIALSLFVGACQAAPTATPTLAPTPTSVSALAAPTATKAAATASPTAAAPAPTATKAPPTPTPAPKSKGKVVLVVNGEIANLDATMEGYAVLTRPVYPSIAEQLTAPSLKDYSVVGGLAES